MRASFGHIQKLSKGHYRAWWYEGDTRRSKRVRSYNEAKDILARMQLKAGSIDHNIDYNEYYKQTIVPTFKYCSKRTKYEQEYCWSYLSKRIGTMKVAKTTWRTVQQVIDELPSPTKQEKSLKLWRKMLNYAVKDEIITGNPCSVGIKTRKPEKKNKVLYTKEELISVLNAVDGTDFAIPVLLECCCGLRQEEFCGLNKRDFDFCDGGWIHITIKRALTEVRGKRDLKETKTEDSYRTICLHKDFLPYILNNLSSIKNKRYIKEYILPSAFRRRWTRYCKSNNIKYVPFGNMRSVYATLCAEAGCLDSLVAKAMGHTGRYIKEKNYQTATLKALKMNAETFADYIKFSYKNSSCEPVSTF